LIKERYTHFMQIKLRFLLFCYSILLIPFICFSQDTVSIKVKVASAPGIQKWDNCDIGITEAKADVDAGKLKIRIYGFSSKVKMSEEDYYSFRRHTIKEIMDDDYGITYDDNDSSSVTAHDCYNQYMDSVIEARFGSDLDKKCQSKVDSMNAIEQQNALKFYGNWDGIIDSLCNTQSPSQCDNITGTINLKLDIDASAYVKNVIITEGFCPGFESELTTVIKSIKWTPATGIIGKKTPCNGALKLIFKKQKLDKFDAYFY
jgi:hypothetical protein